jgi:uncharacterized protein (DUF1330 family)
MVSAPPDAGVRRAIGRHFMKTRSTVAVSMFVGAAVGAAAIQGLHAQAKPKAYLITETEVLDRAALGRYVPQVREAAKAAGGNLDFVPPGENIVALVGDAPKRVGVSEWESMDKARTWFNSAERKALAPQRDKAQKITRQYLVEGK